MDESWPTMMDKFSLQLSLAVVAVALSSFRLGRGLLAAKGIS